ncbi:MAG: cellulase family glycosylhydrolase [Prevotellaceae bacterium]|nr:cellulase family glycosylhydrolase [Prevotellaceae bacterium]
MKKLLSVIVLVCFALSVSAQRWTVEKAKEWEKINPWFCGVNYIPANAVNYTAMWDKTSFSPMVIKKELALMKDLGMNCVRFVMQYKVYEENPSRFIKTLDKVLELCDKAGVKAMPIFFDDCIFGTNNDPVTGKQPEPLEGWYAWAWSPSPGLSMVVDEREHGKLEKYVKDILTHFSDDPRIMLWDLYNEPTNTVMPERSWPLLKKVFNWARTVNPLQPISVGLWNDNEELNNFLVENSDIITYHIYADADKTLKKIKQMKTYGRPVICTEWMNRVAGSTIKDNLHLFAEENSGCMLWGLVNGKTQTHLCWGHRPEQLPYTGVWQHDIFKNNMKPYDYDEIELLRKTIDAKKVEKFNSYM